MKKRQPPSRRSGALARREVGRTGALQNASRAPIIGRFRASVLECGTLRRFPAVTAALISVDYNFVVINNHDYMLPIGAQVMLRKGRTELDVNKIDFRNFRRFSSNMRILKTAPVVNP